MSRRRRGDASWSTRSLLCGLLTAVPITGCGYDRAASSTQPPPPETAIGHVPQSPLVPGMRRTGLAIANPYAGDPGAEAEGKRLYTWMNCAGCHFEGGGGIGPPLMDDDWIYGGNPAQIYDSIASGRANGMPTFGDKLAAQQIWQIVTYVETLNVDGRRAAPTGDDDAR